MKMDNMNTKAYRTEITSMHFARTYELVIEGKLNAQENKYLFDQLLSFWPDGPFKNFDLSFGEEYDLSEGSKSKRLGSMKIKMKPSSPPHICYQASEGALRAALPKYAFWMKLSVYPKNPDGAPRYLKCFWMSDFGPLAMKDVIEEMGLEHDFLGSGDDFNL